MVRHTFTLVEIMLVVAIIGLLAAIVIPSYMASGRDAKRTHCISNLRVIDYAQQQDMLANDSDAPAAAGVNSLLRSPDPVCPSTNLPYALTVTPAACPSIATYPEHKL